MLHTLMEVDSYPTPFSSSKLRGSAGLSLANFRHHKPMRASKRERSPEESEVEVDRPLKRVASGHRRAKIPLSRGSSQQPSENFVKQADGPKTDSLFFQTLKYDRFVTVNEGQSRAVAGAGGGECDMDEDVDMAVEDIVEAEVQMDTQEAPQLQLQSTSYGSQRQSGQQRPSIPNSVLSSRHPYGRLCQHYAHSDPLINVVPATPADSLQSLHQNLGQAASSTQNQAMLSPHRERTGTPPLTSENSFQQEPGISSRHRKRVITFGPRSNCEKCKSGERHHFIHYDYQ